MSRIHSDGYFTFYFLIHSDSLFYILCVRYIWWLLLVVKFPASSTKLEIRKGLVMKLSSAAASITVTNPFAAFSGKTCKSLIHRLTFIANLNQLREITYCKSKSSNKVQIILLSTELGPIQQCTMCILGSTMALWSKAEIQKYTFWWEKNIFEAIFPMLF